MNETTRSTHTMRGVFILLALLLVAVLACTALSAFTLSLTLNSLRSQEELEQTRENDVIIADEYPILSTRHISDAHHAGNISSLTDRDRQTLELALQVLDDIIDDGMTPFEQEEAVFEWMTTHLANDTGLLTVIPTTAQDAHEPYGILTARQGVCVGYATTFRFFMELLGIPCMVIHNEEAYHSWNLVQLDGEWYHVDVYGAIGSGSAHAFNLPDPLMSQNWDTSFFPAATGLHHNPAYRAARQADGVYDIPGWLREHLDSGTEVASLCFSPDTGEDRLAVGEQLVTQALERAASSEEYGHILLSHIWMPIEEGHLLVVYFLNTEEETPELDNPEEQALIDEAVEAAFGDLTPSDPELIDMEWDW